MLTAALILVLTCGGGGSAIKPDTRYVQGNSSFDGSYDYGRGSFQGSNSYAGTVSGTRTQGYADQVDIEINGNGGRIRLPRITLPIVHGGNGGWFTLKGVVVTDRTITGSAVVNFMNKPRVNIDRITGNITINGKNGDYNGQCRAVDTNAQKQF